MVIKLLDENDAIAGRTDVKYDLKDLDFVDMVRVSRPRDTAILNIIEPAKLRNCKTLVDYDDDIFSIPASNYCKPNFSPQAAQISGQIVEKSFSVSVSTPRLKSLLTKLNDNVAVIPNTIDWDIVEAHLRNWEASKKDFYHIVWAGSATHMEDQEIIIEPIKELLKKYDDIKVTFFGWGYNKLLNAYPGKVNYHPPVNQYIYLKILRDLNPDLVVQPLIDHVFNYSKSNIRWLEASSMGIPVLASDVPSFKTLTDKFCLTAPWSESDWYEKMEYAYKNCDKVKKKAIRSQDAIKKYWSIQNMWKAWKSYFHLAWKGLKCTKDFTPDMKKIGKDYD